MQIERLTAKEWRNFDPWEACGQDNFCKRGCHEEGGCRNGCPVPKQYARLGAYEDIGFTPDQVTALITICENIVRDSRPFEPDKIFLHTGDLRRYLRDVGQSEETL